MIGLDHDGDPFAAIDGRDRLDDVVLRGRRFASGRQKVVIVDLHDPENDLYIPVGAIPEDTGGWILVVNPLPIQLAW
jgi:hypothetical protein